MQSNFLLFFQELVAANPSQKNWKGISIAVFVIILVLASVAVSVVIMTPEDEGPRVVGFRIGLDHILSHKYVPRTLNATWISGNLPSLMDSNFSPIKLLSSFLGVTECHFLKPLIFLFLLL